MPRNADAETWLRFALTQGISCRLRLQLLKEFKSPEQVLGASVASLQKLVSANQATALAESGQKPDWPALQAHLDWLEYAENRLLTMADAAYPTQLLDLPDPPTVLFVKGDPCWLGRHNLAIVGSRQATPQGLENAEAFATELARCGYTIVSGLAAGIDAAAHRGGLSAQGSTIAVVGTGLDRVYPAAHRELAHQIAQQGILVSEFALGSPPVAEHFPRRNRLIAALGLGCLVVEATLGSGSLITARQAADLGREVFAIPGSIHSPQSKGCHRLLKEGAKLVESAQDIHEELAVPQLVGVKVPVKLPAQAVNPLLEQMGWEPVDTDTPAMRSGLSADTLNATLLTLELDGVVSALPGGRYQRKA